MSKKSNGRSRSQIDFTSLMKPIKVDTSMATNRNHNNQLKLKFSRNYEYESKEDAIQLSEEAEMNTPGSINSVMEIKIEEPIQNQQDEKPEFQLTDTYKNYISQIQDKLAQIPIKTQRFIEQQQKYENYVVPEIVKDQANDHNSTDFNFILEENKQMKSEITDLYEQLLQQKSALDQEQLKNKQYKQQNQNQEKVLKEYKLQIKNQFNDLQNKIKQENSGKSKMKIMICQLQDEVKSEQMAKQQMQQVIEQMEGNMAKVTEKYSQSTKYLTVVKQKEDLIWKLQAEISQSKKCINQLKNENSQLKENFFEQQQKVTQQFENMKLDHRFELNEITYQYEEKLQKMSNRVSEVQSQEGSKSDLLMQIQNNQSKLSDLINQKEEWLQKQRHFEKEISYLQDQKKTLMIQSQNQYQQLQEKQVQDTSRFKENETKEQQFIQKIKNIMEIYSDDTVQLQNEIIQKLKSLLNQNQKLKRDQSTARTLTEDNQQLKEDKQQIEIQLNLLKGEVRKYKNQILTNKLKFDDNSLSQSLGTHDKSLELENSKTLKQQLANNLNIISEILSKDTNTNYSTISASKNKFLKDQKSQGSQTRLNKKHRYFQQIMNKSVDEGAVIPSPSQQSTGNLLKLRFQRNKSSIPSCYQVIVDADDPSEVKDNQSQKSFEKIRNRRFIRSSSFNKENYQF